MEDAFSFDQVLCWWRGSEGPECHLELHLHGGFGVADALRQCLERAGWTAEPEAKVGGEDKEVMLADSPLALRIRAARAGHSLDAEQVRLRSLGPQQRQREWEDLLRLRQWSELLRRPRDLVLAGPPNVGKTTLFNLWLGEERATASPLAGTTRDPIRERIRLGQGATAFDVQLVDTAGIWQAGSEVDQLAVDASRLVLQTAWRVLWLLDPNEAPDPAMVTAITERTGPDPVLLHPSHQAPLPPSLPRERILRMESAAMADWPTQLEGFLLHSLGAPPAPGVWLPLGEEEWQQLQHLSC